ncbi:MAG: hypothetical protein WAJ99_08615, partial [Candidatus Sulfotelmatobacter sp.]
MKALREEVERLRLEVEHNKSAETSIERVAAAPVAPANASAPSGGAVAKPPATSIVPPVATTEEPAQVVAGAPSSEPTKTLKIAPFSDWDWTWLNGNPRNKDTAFDS